MDFTPGERAVLGQIRVLYAASARLDQQMKALTMQWTPTHYDTYSRAYRALIAKALICDSGGQAFTITEAGLRAIGVSAPRPQPVRAAAPSPVPQPLPAAPAPRASLLRRAIGLFGRR